MNTLIDLTDLFALLDPSISYRSATATIALTALDNLFDDILQKVKDIDAGFIKLGEDIEGMITPFREALNVGGNAHGIRSEERPLHSAAAIAESVQATEHITEVAGAHPKKEGEEHSLVKRVNSVVKPIATFTETVDNAFDFLEVVGAKLPDKLNKTVKAAKSIMGFFKGAGEMAEGIGEAAVAAEEAGGIMAAAESIALGTIEFGPVGWLVGAGALAGGEISAWVNNGIEEDRKKDASRKAEQRQEALATFDVPGRKEANAYVNSTPGKQTTPISSFNLFGNGKNAPGDSAFEIPLQQRLAVTDAFTPVYPVDVAKHLEQTVKLPESYLQRGSGLYYTLLNLGQTKGKKILDERIAEIWANKASSKYHLNDKELLYTFQHVRADLTNDAHEGKMKQTMEIQHAGNGRPTGETERVSAGGRVINLNLNKPLIDHFIVNVSNSKEGVGELKHKVEEALVEIFNSIKMVI